ERSTPVDYRHPGRRIVPELLEHGIDVSVKSLLTWSPGAETVPTIIKREYRITVFRDWRHDWRPYRQVSAVAMKVQDARANVFPADRPGVKAFTVARRDS